MKEKKYFLNLLAIITLNIINGVGSYENAAVQTMIDAWPNLAPATIRMMMTIPSLTSTLVMMVIGQFVGKKISFKNCILLGSTALLCGGILPFFFHANWYFILACRVLLGLGMGMLSIRSSLLIISSKPEDTAKMMGLGTVLGSLVSASIAPISGKLATLNWYYPFLTNAIILVAIILVLLFMQEPEQVVEKKKTTGKAHIPGIIYFLFMAQIVVTVVMYPLLSGISTYLVQLNLGDASVAGMMLSLYTGSGMVTNLCLHQLQKTFKDKVLPIFLMVAVIGLALVLFTNSIYGIAVGVFLSGMGYVTYLSSIQLYAGRLCDEQTIVKVSPLLMAMQQCGIFLSSLFIEASSQLGWFSVGMKNPYFICMVVYFIAAITMYLLRKQLCPSQE